MPDPTPAATPPLTPSALRVLLLEDSAFDAELLQEALRASYPDAHVDVVKDEPSFVQALAQGYDVVLSDFEVPGFGGNDALALARRLVPHTPFIFVSGVIGEDNAVELLKNGATDYVSKSRLGRLALVLARALDEVAERRARSAVESRLRTADEIFGSVVDALREYAIVLLDARGRITNWNSGAQALWGWQRDDVAGASAAMLVATATAQEGQAPVSQDEAAEMLEDEMRQARQEGRVVTQRWMQRRDGSRMWVEGTMTPLYGRDGVLTGFCCVSRDSTSDYLREQELRAARDQAESARLETERASRAKDRFLAVLSHELRTPLSAISYASHLLQKVAQVPDKYADLLTMVRRNVLHEARLIDDLLDMSAVTNGKLRLKFAQVDLGQVARDSVAMVKEQAEERGVRLALAVPRSPAWVWGDPLRLQQIAANLLRNGIKFSDAGGEVALALVADGGHWVLTCADRGIGIEREALHRIFNAFEQADEEIARQRGGLGLGLAIANYLATEHGGRLEANSGGRGRGATFTLRMAAMATASEALAEDDAGRSALQADGAAATQDEDAALALGQDSQPPAPRLLLVEDNLLTAQAITMCLEDYGYHVTHSTTVAGAILAACQQSYDVVLTDLGLPDGSGIDVGRALIGSVPVVALSGYGSEADIRQTSALGFAGHVVKPADPEQIHAVLQGVLVRGAAARPTLH